MDDGEDDVMMLDGVPEQLVIDTKDSEIDGTARDLAFNIIQSIFVSCILKKVCDLMAKRHCYGCCGGKGRNVF